MKTLMNSAVRILLFAALLTPILGRWEIAFAQSEGLVRIQVGADEGDQEAQLELANAYLAGGIVPRDRLMAYFWFNLAVASGGVSAIEIARSNEAWAARDKLGKLLTPEQIGQAEAMGREWRPKEVLGSDSLKTSFAEKFNLLLLPVGDPSELYKVWRTEKVAPVCISIATQQPESKVSDPSAQAAFDSGLKQIIAASGKDFHSLRGKFDGVAGSWVGNVSLLGMKCTIEEVPSGDTNNLHFGATVRYRCVAQKDTSDIALSLYNDLLNMMIVSTGGEPVVDYNFPKMKRVKLRPPPEGKDDPFIAVEFRDLFVRTDHDVYTVIFDVMRPMKVSTRNAPAPAETIASSPRVGAAATDSGVETDIRREIDSIARSGQYSPLPEPQLGLAKNRDATSATRIIRNDTAYALHVLMSGPVDRKIDLAPGGSASIALPAGSYRVAARADSGSVRPFYGVQVLEVGIEYTSQFYIK